MASVASQLIEEATAHAKNDSLEDAREICADGNYFPNNLRMSWEGVVLVPLTSSVTVEYDLKCRREKS